VTLGTVLCVLTWIAVTLAFALYVDDVASYGAIFGSLAAVFLLLTYLYLSACALLAGAQLDAVMRKQQTGSTAGTWAQGDPHRRDRPPRREPLPRRHQLRRRRPGTGSPSALAREGSTMEIIRSSIDTQKGPAA
jgi:membrane protein